MPDLPRGQGPSSKGPWIAWEWIVLIVVVVVALVLGILAVLGAQRT